MKCQLGQDLIEYALLAAFLAIASWGGVRVLGDAMTQGYAAQDRAVQDLWQTPEPSGR